MPFLLLLYIRVHNNFCIDLLFVCFFSRPHHILYPMLSDGSLAEITYLCQLGQITGDWKVMQEMADLLNSVISQASKSLRITT